MVEVSDEKEHKAEESIKSMHLYDQGRLDFPLKELQQRGIDLRQEGTTVAVADLVPLIMLNYTANSDYAALGRDLALNKDSVLFDLGSGLGGPAMKLCDEAKCKVIGLELQNDLCESANHLARKCGLFPQTRFYPGDIMDEAHAFSGDEYKGSFDGMLSILAILHIPAEVRKPLFKRCRSLLKDGAHVYIEDFFIQSNEKGEACELSPEEARLLEKEVSVPGGTLPTRAEYIAEVQEAGFGEVQFEDCTDEWAAFVTQRHDEWIAKKERHTEVHGSVTWTNLNTFFCAVRVLFERKNLRGTRLRMRAV